MSTEMFCVACRHKFVDDENPKFGISDDEKHVCNDCCFKAGHTGGVFTIDGVEYRALGGVGAEPRAPVAHHHGDKGHHHHHHHSVEEINAKVHDSHNERKHAHGHN